MEPLAFARRTALGLLGTLLAGLVLAVTAHANELAASGAAHGLVIHDATETLRDWCRTDDAGRLWLTLPDGSRFELVTSTADPAIANPGDGAFHPFEPAELRAALGELRFPVGALSADVFVLPYPRRSGLQSAAGPGLVLLSPGVLPLPREQQHAEFVHELGHVVQYARMPDADATAWARYRAVRGISDLTLYNAAAPHDQRPHEIFAEDFRALFGGPTATYSGTIENPDLTPPQQVAGLRDLVLGLAGPPLAARLAATPSPSHGAVVFSRAGADPTPVDVFDVSGRRLATLMPLAVSGGAEWRWDGRAAGGARLAPAVVFARERGGASAPVRVTLLP